MQEVDLGGEDYDEETDEFAGYSGSNAHLFQNNSTNNIQNALLGLANTVSQYNTPGMAHGGYVPEKGFGGLIQYRKGY